MMVIHSPFVSVYSKCSVPTPWVATPLQSLVSRAPIRSSKISRRLHAPLVEIPELSMKKAASISTQAAFGQIMLEIGRYAMDSAMRCVL